MYAGAITVVRTVYGNSKGFEAKVGTAAADFFLVDAKAGGFLADE